MNESAITDRVNSLSYLIPTDIRDIAVRDILIPIFGDGIACKVPGAPCGNQTVSDPGALVGSLISVFNGSTMIFATIMLIFIAILGFIKTAQDGEFFGRSWNTTFTALRLVAGIGFLLPMPNNYSTIQNFVLYNALWASGAANEANIASSEHYLRRLQLNMIKQEPGGTTMNVEAQNVLEMHICASLINKVYGPRGAKLEYQRTAMTSADASASATGGVEFTYTETGNYLPTNSAPCGRLVVKPLGALQSQAEITDPTPEGIWLGDTQTNVQIDSGVPTEGVWNAALGAAPLTHTARAKIAESLQAVASNARASKLTGIDSLMKPTSTLRRLADRVVDRFVAYSIQYNDDGSVRSAPSAANGSGGASPFDATFARSLVTDYATIVRGADTRFNDDIDKFRKKSLESSTAEGGGSFFAQAKDMLQRGGWMSSAATYRTMLDMASIQFVGEQQSPYTFERRDSALSAATAPSPGGLSDQIASLSTAIQRVFAADTSQGIITAGLGTANQYASTPPPMSEAKLETLINKPSLNTAMETLYGNSWLNGFRNAVIKGLTISGDYDPLYQIKSIGDMATLSAEAITVAEFGARTATATGKVGVTAAKSNLVGRVVNILTGAGATGEALFSQIQYVLEQVFVIMKVLSAALIAIGFMFSTWLPAVPFMAFLLSTMGWLMGLTMTLFAVNIWAVMHLTPAQNDSFIGSQSQGYLLLAGLFFRPIIAVSALSLSFVIAPPVMKLINVTLLPTMFANNVSTNTISVITATVFGLILYFSVAKAALLMVYMLPQSFPDEVLRFIGAGIGDLGQSKGMSTMEGSEGSSRVAIQSLEGMNKASSEGFKGTMKGRRDAAEKALEAEKALTAGATPNRVTAKDA